MAATAAAAAAAALVVVVVVVVVDRQVRVRIRRTYACWATNAMIDTFACFVTSDTVLWRCLLVFCVFSLHSSFPSFLYSFLFFASFLLLLLPRLFRPQRRLSARPSRWGSISIPWICTRHGDGLPRGRRQACSQVDRRTTGRHGRRGASRRVLSCLVAARVMRLAPRWLGSSRVCLAAYPASGAYMSSGCTRLWMYLTCLPVRPSVLPEHSTRQIDRQCVWLYGCFRQH
ncbi:hypothetical protein BKA80DRAFT_285578 [Phyllosticta citrichinensis]